MNVDAGIGTRRESPDEEFNRMMREIESGNPSPETKAAFNRVSEQLKPMMKVLNEGSEKINVLKDNN